jgi:hypothetical protein
MNVRPVNRAEFVSTEHYSAFEYRIRLLYYL